MPAPFQCTESALHNPGSRDLPGAPRPDRTARQSQGRRFPSTARKSRPFDRPASDRPAITAPLRHHASMMARMFGYHAAPELVTLWCLEVLGCGLLIYLLLTSGLLNGAPAQLPRLQAANQAAALALTLGAVSFAVGLYSSDIYAGTRRLLAGTALGWIVALPAVGVVGPAVGIHIADTGMLPPLAALTGWTLFVLAVRLAFSHAIRANLFVRRVLVVCADPGDAAAERLAAALRAFRIGAFQVISVLPVGEATNLTRRLLRSRKVWGIIVTDSARNLLAPEQMRAWRGCHLYGDAEFWESRLGRIDIDRAGAAGRPRVHGRSRHRLDAALTRTGDILLSLLLLLFTLPLMVVTALLIKLDSPGPVLYRKERVGLHGRPFILLKFRSMRVDAEARGPVWATARDPRVTRVGASIRLLRIDELPQLFNVLRGQMSFIGPRPERPHFVDQLAGTVPLYRERAWVKPGLTGWAQVSYPYGASVEDARVKLSYDLYYVKHRNLFLALLILFSTVWVVLFQKGAR